LAPSFLRGGDEHLSWDRPRLPETAVFAGLEGIVRGVTLFDMAGEQFEARVVEGPDADSLYQLEFCKQ
jgi:hypothetical protein